MNVDRNCTILSYEISLNKSETHKCCENKSVIEGHISRAKQDVGCRRIENEHATQTEEHCRHPQSVDGPGYHSAQQGQMGKCADQDGPQC